ncbi:exonuclease domain-containing protein [Ulvibacter antarcticus]|uniref:Excinuclease cho n=1 Tax=Ulvibacter antarcticus TaxID=442714 RepID=A0A3L9YDQ8_9FLAO|nr:exonuclease domain-containing protein [Ulvibacter antarcticus]RMA58791.1 DNA polymerase-3 subunit epsilon [Ulvibacter antarcticus]
MNFTASKYSIIDVETTGGVRYGRMTEICIITIENMQVVDVYQSLLNPEVAIPRNITALTGITNEMVQDAPKFHEIANIILEKTENAIFVAHSVNFDFGFLKKEFDSIGLKFSKRKLCTVRLSRKLIPGLKSYSLGRLCRDIGINLIGAHRAEADTRATAMLFLKLLAIDQLNEFKTFTSFLNKSSRQATLPPNISTEDFEKLPETPGIYIFKDKLDKVLYVGKAKNIKSRVLSHIYSKSQNSLNLCTETFHLDFEETGNELTALLLEADYIRRFYPKFNKAQKRPAYTYQIISYRNQRNIIQLALGRTKNSFNSVLTIYNKTVGLETLMELCSTYNLCPKYCSLQTTNEACTHYKITNCRGICSKNEPTETYNERVLHAINELDERKETYVIIEKGRTVLENCIILVENGTYFGFGFIEKENTVENFEDFRNYINRYQNTYHTSKILRSYARKDINQHRFTTAENVSFFE